MPRRRQMGVVEMTFRLILSVWLFLSFTSMALLGVGHTAAVWCSKHSVPTNPACRFISHVLTIEET